MNPNHHEHCSYFQPSNQSSILEFFCSQQTSTPKSADRKRKISTEQDNSHCSFGGTHSEKPSSSHRTGMKDTVSHESSSVLNSKSTKKLKLSDIVVVSDDDEEAFKCDIKRSKGTTKKKKKPKPKTIQSQKLLGNKKVRKVKEKSSMRLDTNISIILSDEESNPLPIALSDPDVSGPNFSSPNVSGPGVPNLDRLRVSENLIVNDTLADHDIVMSSKSFVKSKDSVIEEAASDKLSILMPGESDFNAVHSEPDFNITDDTFFDSPPKMGDNSNIETHLISPMEECDVKDVIFTNETVASCKNQDPKTPVKHPRVTVPESPDQTDTNHWSCKACTYLNHLDLPHCEICDTPKSRHRVRKSQQNNAKTQQNSHEMNSSPKSGSTKKHALTKEIFSPSKVDESLDNVKDQVSSGPDQLDPLHRESELEVITSPFTRISRSNDSPPSRHKRHKPIKHGATGLSEESILKTLSPDSIHKSPAIENHSKSLEQSDTETYNLIENNSNTSKCPEQFQMEINNSYEESTAKTVSFNFMNVAPTANNTKVSESSNRLEPKADNSISTDVWHAGDEQIIPGHQVFKFSCSLYTGRIYVYDEVCVCTQDGYMLMMGYMFSEVL